MYRHKKHIITFFLNNLLLNENVIIFKLIFMKILFKFNYNVFDFTGIQNK